jgi:cell division protein FtsQ
VAAPRREVALSRVLPSRTSIFVGLAVFACAVGGYTVARESPLFAVAAVQVRGGSPAVQRQIAKALSVEVGTSLLKVDGRVVERRLASVPWVASTSFDRAFPHTLVVTVKPERPVAVLRRGAKSWLVSARARVLAELQRGARPGLPRIWIGNGAAAVPPAGAYLADAQGAVAARTLAPLAAVRFPAGVGAVTTGEDELTLVLRSGLELRLGDPGDLRLKLAVARRVLALLPALGADAYVDVSVPERPVATTNPQPEALG